MEMIPHQAPGMRLPPGFAAGFRQRLEKIMAVHLIQKNSLPPIAPAHDMVNRTRIFDA
jgi:hypothetical protein